MSKKVCADDSLADALCAFLKAEKIALDLANDDCTDLRIQVCGQRNECDRETLYAGGWIACGTALALADKLQLSTHQVGAIMNHLKIKIKHCSLGCFQ